jgi:hypothetical protein
MERFGEMLAVEVEQYISQAARFVEVGFGVPVGNDGQKLEMESACPLREMMQQEERTCIRPVRIFYEQQKWGSIISCDGDSERCDAFEQAPLFGFRIER